MKTRAMLALTAVAGIAAGASAQAITTGSNVTYALSWSEVNGNGNNNLEPGESALLVMNTSFTNQGQLASFSPPIGPFTSGTILGFGSGFLDLRGTGGTAGAFNYSSPPNNSAGTSGFGVRGGWRIAGNASHGTPNGAGDGMINIQPGQFPNPDLPNSTNPINGMYRLLWTPSSYTERIVTFSLARAAVASATGASVYLDLDGSVGSSVYVAESNISYGSVNIPIGIPAPASLAMLGLGGLVAAGRRRQAWGRRSVLRVRKPLDAGCFSTNSGQA
jgi:hypothetical protein